MADRADAHYTPEWVADRVASEVVKLVEGPSPRVADFAAGEGALLSAVSRAIPSARIVATDIDPGAVRVLKSMNPLWAVGSCDLLSTRSRAGSPLLRARGSGADLVVLNPPFSQRGGAAFPVLGGECKASPAMTFLVHSIEQLVEGGSAVALLPAGALHAQKDARLWTRLREAASVEVVEQFDRTTFRGEHAVVCMVVLRSVSVELLRGPWPVGERVEVGRFADSRGSSQAPDVLLVRGTQQMHAATVSRRGVPLVHSTHLVGGSVNHGSRVVSTGRTVSGPAVLLARVGAPDETKVGLHLTGEEIVLSDCVFALQTPSKAAARRVRATILANWQTFTDLYVGSCARYLTVRRLRTFLEKEGFSVLLLGREH